MEMVASAFESGALLVSSGVMYFAESSPFAVALVIAIVYYLGVIFGYW